METSREDVGIVIRSAFLAKGSKQKFSLFALVVLSIIFIFVETIETKPLNYFRAFIKDVIYRGASVVSAPSKSINNFADFVKEHVHLYDDYSKLKKENNELKIFYTKYKPQNISEFKNKKVIAFAGIGNPENFFNLLKDNNINVVKEIKNLESRPVFKKDTSTQNEAKNLKLNDAILMKDISFDYEEGRRTTLKNINLQIKKGKSVGIIGKSGSGKSTLVDIMLGLLEPQKGGVYFDNKNIKNELSLWQKQIGYIPQDIYLLDDTIKKNITFGLKDDEIDEKLLLQTLKAAQLKDFVDTLPDAINTFVGNRGVKLSGGERQRIGIARAMYNLPKIMVFDEATSSLDIENENKILDEIYENRDDKTLIIISHRNNTVKYCDLIYVLEDGKLIDQGSFKEIINKYGYLKEMNIK